MKAFWITLLFASSLTAAEPSLNLEKFTVPEFDGVGIMLRRLSAESAKGSPDKPTLGKGRLEFFGQRDGQPELLGHLDFEEAAYDRSLGVIRGSGAVRFESAKGSISGKGFSFDPTKSELQLDAEVVVNWPAATVKAAAATVVFSAAAEENQTYVVESAALSGGVEATDIKAPKVDLERAAADHAAYSATDGLLRIASPVTYWRAGQKGVLEAQEVQISVGKVAVPAAQGAAEKAAP